MVAAGLVAALAVIAQVEAATPDAGAPTESAPVPPSPEPEPVAEPAPQPVLQAPPRPRRYGDKGSVELGLGLTYSSKAGFAAAGSARYFVVDGVAPGVDATFVAGGTDASRYGLLLAALRLVPLRFNTFAFALTGRAGRVFIGDHSDGWGAGGALSVLLLFSPTVGLELGYELLHLFPATFCTDVGGCNIYGPIIAVRFGF
ncbi:MAG TPA: hypothetical protein VN903_23835 [Polyangia bacterium]|jgi:hypothetical protein|nr:hypothetical protein [Polyangia bacterium]